MGLNLYSKGEAGGFRSLRIPYDTKKEAGGDMSHLLRFTDSAINIDYQKKLICHHFHQASDPGPDLYGFGTLPSLLSLVHFLKLSRIAFFVFSLSSRLKTE